MAIINFIKRYQVWLIFVFALIIYFRQYLANFSLRLDEAMVSLSIIKLPISSFLHQPLPDLQVAPLGFLVVEKICVTLFGNTEQILRLFPFLCGIASLWLFYQMAKIYLNEKFVIYALFSFVVTPPLIYFASQVKPYMTDVFFVLLSYVVIAQWCLKELAWKKTILIGLLGAIVIWFSFPVLFVLFAIALSVLWDTCIQKRFDKFPKLGVIFLCWLGSFILFYYFFFNDLTGVAATTEFTPWQKGYISLENWLGVLIKVLYNPIGIPYFLSWLGMILFLLGAYAYFKADTKKFMLLLMPVFFVILASVFHKYPLKGRLMLFAIPVFLIITFQGVQTLALKVGREKRWPAFLLIVILFSLSFLKTAQAFIDPGCPQCNHNEDIKPVLAYVQKHQTPEDILFVCFASRPAFEYYAPKYGFSKNQYHIQAASYINYVKPQSQDWKNSLERVRGSNRTWIIISTMMGNKVNEKHTEELLLEYISESGGQLLDKFLSRDAGAYLFDLSKLRLKQ